MITRRQLLAGASSATALLVAGCTAPGPTPSPTDPRGAETPQLPPDTHQVIARTPTADVVVPPGADAALAASRAVLAAASAVVVVADGADPSAQSTAAQLATDLGIPAFIETPDLAAELDRLQTRTVIALGAPTRVGDREVVAAPASAADLNLRGLPAKAEASGVLVVATDEPDELLAATLRSAGLETPLSLTTPHPGATADTVAAVREHDGPVIAVGDGFGTDAQFAAQVTATRTHKELPGGGIVPFPTHHMIALYGHPQTAALGMMGEQPPAEAVERLNKLVAQYREHMPDKTVIGSFEIITTVASAQAGDDGDYSYETPIPLLMPWIEAAEANDIYVVLDLQPGRTDFLTQAKRYEELLRRPYVGLALDPEWRLKPDQKHLRAIGQVHVDEVNAVTEWLADLVAEHALPPKVLTLHQFQTRMIIERERLDTSRVEVQHLVHVDGQGGQGAKQGTWGVIRRDLPADTYLGWKNFEDEDLPMLTPRQTVEQVQPTPHFISYQ